MIGRGSVTAAPKAASHRPPPYLECIRRYTAGEHWHAHEVLEDLWRATSDPERRRFYQGIIQLAAAFVHAERGNMRGVQRLLAKAAAKLDAVSSPYLGIDVAGLLRAMAAAGREARAAEADPQRSFDWRCKPRLSLMAE
jgi:predicted metal-dependent hydrolase